MELQEINVLLVEDNLADARLLREAIREVEHSHINLIHVETLARALRRLDTEQFDVIMLDLSLPDAEGLETLLRTHNRAPSVPIVVLTGLNDEELAIRAVREGAQDYLVKGQVTSHLLVRAMRYATERKRAVEALQHSEEYFRSLIENALDIIAVLEEDGRVSNNSPSFERTLGYPQGALKRADVFELIHPEDVESSRRMVEAGAKHPGTSQQFEFRARHRNGTWRTLEAIGKWFGAETAVNGYVLNCRDVTERKRSEEQLRKANDTLRAVIEASPLAIYSLDLQGNVKSWNSAAQEMFGFPAAEVLFCRLPIVAEEDLPAFYKRLSDAALGDVAGGVETKAVRRDGSTTEISIWNAILRDEWGAVDGIVEAVANITERKRLEEQFRQVQKMEAVGRLAGGVAHDFNNLLTVITGYCQMLYDQLGQGHPMAGDVQQVLKAADRATALTRQLLAFSRRQIVQPRIVDAAHLVTDMVPMLERLLGETVHLIIRSQTSAACVRVDPGNIEQVIVNLVVNARDAMPGGGTVYVELRSVRVHADMGSQYITLPEGQYLVIDVCDTGVGMSEEVMRHLFEPFFTTKEKNRGTGLGLSTSYGIIKQNHGEILVKSRVGEGSTFSIYLPHIDEPCEIPGTAVQPRLVGGHETILLAEDEDGVRKVTTEMLRKQGYNVLAAVNGSHALEVASRGETRIDLLITDMVMPGMSGRELADQLRAKRPGTKVLFVSGYTDSGIVTEGELNSETAFLQKPFKPEDLGRKVREVLASRAPEPVRFP
ncbi:MAG: response regulator [Bryobacteraceae bacterium]|nr:response regulator [Bryobacteraceae bacterium]